jgi:predicted DsbA family dithiol-disulfide isomerase
MALGLVLLLPLGSGCDELKPIGTRGSRSTSSGGPKVKLEFYIMSKCPYGVQVAQGIKPVLDKIGGWIDFSMDYIVNEREGKLVSMHGEPELKGNIIQLCAMKHYPDIKKHMGFIDCMNKNWRQIPEGWEGCADQTGLDKGRLKSCVEGNQGMELLRASHKRAQARNAQGSPTMYLAGQPYNGGRDEAAFMRAICEKMTGDNRPKECADIKPPPPPPPDVPVSAIVLTDKRCKKCQTAGLVANLKGRFFSKLTVKTLDYGEPEGKKLFKELGLKMLPVMLFEKGVEKSPKYGNIARWMVDAGPYKQLRIPAQFDPTAEICDNKKDDTGNGKVDCADPTCKEKIICRKEIPRKLEVFVMSQCPYGVKALDAMKEILPNFKGKMKFEIHFIADKTPTGFNALHGQPEVDENICELCAIKHYPKNHKYMDYIWCRNKNIRSAEWKECAKDGISAAVMEKCFSGGEGKRLLEEDIKIARNLGVSGSPTWLANNKFKFGGIAPEAIKNNYCQHNKGLAGCDKKLTEQAGAPAGACGK